MPTYSGSSGTLSGGYGFGDMHINQVMRDWLEFSNERRLVIVGPECKSTPPFFLHLASQVRSVASTAVDYLRQFGFTQLSEEELAARERVLAIREVRRRRKGFA